MPESTQAYLDLVGDEHRKRFGQFFTDPVVAETMCRWVLRPGVKRLFDPAFGLGAFYEAARALEPDVEFSGFEVDPKILDFYRGIATAGNVDVICTDYLSAWNQHHAAIVCNPPYMRFQLFRRRASVFSEFRQHLSITLLGYTNMASAFLLKSVSELTEGGRLAYVMPLEFLNTGYGVQVKRFLLQSGCLRALIRLACEKDAFPDATTSVGVILAAREASSKPVQFHNVRRLADLPSVLTNPATREVEHSALDPAEKWLRFFDGRERQFALPSLVRLNHYGGFSRGIATGANEFFALSANTAAKLELPRSSLVRCITRSSQVQTLVLTDDDLARLEQVGARVLLFDANGVQDRAALQYIRHGTDHGYNLRYLTRTRTPWYRLERRAPAPILFGVFSRNGYKVIRNLSRAINLTCYHGFFPNCFGADAVDKLFLYLQSRAGRHILQVSMRQYGDGLGKFEPDDLNDSLAPSPQWFSCLSEASVAQGIDACCRNQSLDPEIERIFDSLLEEAAPSVR